MKLDDIKNWITSKQLSEQTGLTVRTIYSNNSLLSSEGVAVKVGEWRYHPTKAKTALDSRKETRGRVRDVFRLSELPSCKRFRIIEILNEKEGEMTKSCKIEKLRKTAGELIRNSGGIYFDGVPESEEDKEKSLIWLRYTSAYKLMANNIHAGLDVLSDVECGETRHGWYIKEMKEIYEISGI